MKKLYTEQAIAYFKEHTKIPVSRESRDHGNYLHNLKGKTREAMFAAVQIANEQIEKKVEGALKNSLHNKRALVLKKIAIKRKDLFKKVDAQITKELETFMQKEGLSEIEGVVSKAYGDVPYSIYWHGLNNFERVGEQNEPHNPFLARELFAIKSAAQKDLIDLRNSLLAIQETGLAKPKPVNFPEPIKAELQKFENRGLLVANVPEPSKV